MTDAETAVLEALAAQGEILESKPGTCSPPFRSRLRVVDSQRSLLLLDRGPDAVANIALLALLQAELQVEWGEWRIAFVASNPRAFTYEGAEAIRVDFPDAVEIKRRRLYERTSGPRPALRCVAYVGDDVLVEASVTDLSRGGVGLQIQFAADELEPGTILVGCHLEYPGQEPVIVDLEVRHTVLERHGPRVVRAGCRFVNLSPAAMALIARHVSAKPPGR